MRLSICSILCVISLHVSAQGGQILDQVIARVGREYILYSDIQELYVYSKSRNPDYAPEMQCDIIDQLISKKLLLDQARLDSIIIADIEVEVELDRRIEMILRQMGGDENMFIEVYGKSIQEQKEETREPTKEQMIEQRVQGSLLRNVEITPNEVVAFFNEIPTDSLPYLNAEVEVGEISMKTIISEEAKQNAKEKLESIRLRVIEGGESFAELASIFSDDPGSARTGGDLGWARRGSYVPEFEAMAFSLDIGEYSEVVETEFGYHFMQLIERRGNAIHLRHVLVRPEVTQADYDRTRDSLNKVRDLLMADSIDFELAVRRYSDDKTQSYNNVGRMINPDSGDSFWETAQLPYQIYFAIEPLDIGGYSEVLEVEERGEKVYKLIQLQSRSKPHLASLTTDFSRIKEFAKESKRYKLFNEWMDRKVKNTFIEIMEEFRVCPILDKYFANKDIKP